MFLKSINWPILAAIIPLLSIGILVIYSSSPILALQQFIFAVIGLVFFVLLSQFDYHLLEKFSWIGYLTIIFLLVLVLFLGIETRGSIRWIPLGIFNIQPSEFAKPVMMIFLAAFWVHQSSSWKSILKSLLFFVPVIWLIFKQPDLGTTLTLGSLWFGTLFATRIDLRKILAIILIVMMVLPMFWFTLKSYQRQRITGFLSPTSDPLGVGYNLIQATIAVGSGEVFGRGLGYGTQSRLQFLPEFRTDFIFANIAEEFGFLGSGLILLIYLFLVSYCLKVATRVDYFGSLISIAVAVIVFFQVSVNVGMNLGALPITGITLPLVSYGGSSLISTMISLGIVSSVAKRQREVDREA